MDKAAAHTQETQKAGGISASVERHLRAYFDAHEDDMPAAGLYARVIQEVEMPLLKLVLAKCNGNQLRAATLLGLNRNTLRKKIVELGLESTVKQRRSRVRRTGKGNGQGGKL